MTSLTATSSVANTYKAFNLIPDANVLPCYDREIAGLHLDGFQFGRNFSPSQVTISYGKLTRVKVFNITGPGRTWGSVTYYDPNSVLANTSQYKYGKNMKPLSAMPSWLSSLVNPNI